MAVVFNCSFIVGLPLFEVPLSSENELLYSRPRMLVRGGAELTLWLFLSATGVRENVLEHTRH